LQKAKKKILLLSWAIPPTIGGSSYVSYELAKGFSKDYLILVGGKKLFKKVEPIFREENKPAVYYLNSEINIKGHGDRFFKLFRYLLLPFLFIKLIYIARKEEITDFLVTFPDEYYLILGHLSAKLLNKKLHLYFHNTYLENRNGLALTFARFYQNVVFEHCSNFFTMSEGMTTFYRRNYPGLQAKVSTLPHTFSAYLPIESKISDQVFKFILFGTFNHSNIESTKRLLMVLSKVENVEVDIYTPINQSVLKYKWNLDVEVLGCNYHLSDPSKDIHLLIQKYDGCILTHGFTGGYSDDEYKTIFPTRTIPMMLSGRPILAHSPPDCFLSEFIEKNNVAMLITTMDLRKIEDSIRQFIRSFELRTQFVNNSRNALSYFYGKNVVEYLKKTIGED